MEFGSEIEIRTPVIPGVNDTETDFAAAADFLKDIGFKGRVKLLPFNALASAKYAALGLDYAFGGEEKQSCDKMRRYSDFYASIVIDCVVG